MLSFAQAMAIVCPDASQVIPGSPQHKEILMLMRQSGRIFAEDNVPVVPQPIHSVGDLKPLRERPQVVSKPLSKREWLTPCSRKQELDCHLAANAPEVCQDCVRRNTVTIPWCNLKSTCDTKGISKAKWISLLK